MRNIVKDSFKTCLKWVCCTKHFNLLGTAQRKTKQVWFIRTETNSLFVYLYYDLQTTANTQPNPRTLADEL